MPDRVRRALFLVALERGFLDAILDRFVIEPFMTLARRMTRVDQWLCDAVMPAHRPAAITDGEDRDE
jgi:hypothetical protein